MRRLSLLAFVSVICILLTTASAQTPQQKPRSIVLKFRSTAQMARPSAALEQQIVSVSANSTLAPLFPQRGGSSKISVQSYAINGGLDRIILLPLKEGVDAQQAVALLAQFPELEYAEPNYIYHIEAFNTRTVFPDPGPRTPGPDAPNDSLFAQDWALHFIHAPEAWAITKGDTSIHIGFIDTGVDWLHPDLAHQFAVNPKEDINHNGLFDAWSNKVRRKDLRGDSVTGDLNGIDDDGNGFADDVIGFDFVDQASLNFGDYQQRDGIPEDENGHGTSVASVLAAEQNNGIGTSGVAPGCRLVALRAFDATGNAEDDDIASAIVYAADNGVRILNLSFGDIYSSMLQRDAVRYAVAKGVIIFGSSGNSGGDGPHYPSDVDEVVSVGGTLLDRDTHTEIPWIFTTLGEGMDILAPSDSVWCATTGGKYAALAGTSVASPIAAGVAALLLSKHPTLEPVEVRSILESSTRFIGARAYTHQTANGRVDALGALEYRGSAAIKITSPHWNTGFNKGEIVFVNGSAMSTLFERYFLYYARGLNPDRNANFTNADWTVITSSDQQVADGELGVWSTENLEPGDYTLRLAVVSSDQRFTEERMVVHVFGKSPTITSFSIDTLYINDRRGLQFHAIGDQLTRAGIRFGQVGSNTWHSKKDDHMTREHAVVLSTDDIEAGASLDVELMLINTAGDSVAQSLVTTIPNEGVSRVGFVQKSYTLPPGFALDTVLTTIDGDHQIVSAAETGNFGPVKAFRFDAAKQKFRVVDSLQETWIPRALGNTRGTGGAEVLLQVGTNSAIYKANASHPIFGDKIFSRFSDPFDQFSASKFGDLDGDGRDEIVLLRDAKIGQNHTIHTEYFEALKWSGSSYDSLGVMNTPGGSYVEPNTAIADLNGDGKTDVIAVTEKADVLAYTFDNTQPSKFTKLFTLEHEGHSEGNLIASGDFNGDGKPDIAVAYHRLFDIDTLGEYEPPYWTVKVYLNQGSGEMKLAYTDNFLYSKNLLQYKSSILAIRNVTGSIGDNLELSLFPNFYLLQFDQTRQTMKPVWYNPVSFTARGTAAWDFDKNGIREFGFLNGDSIRFYERDGGYADRTPSPGAFVATPRDVDRVDLAWSPVTGATKYYILRAGESSSQYDVIDSTTATTYVDRTVSDGDVFHYSVQAIDPSRPTPVSASAADQLVRVNPMPRIEKARVVMTTPHTLTVPVTQILRTDPVSGGTVTIDDNITASTVTIANDTTIIVTLASDLTPGNHTVRIATMELRDQWNSPFDTSDRVDFIAPIIASEGRFYLIRWSFANKGEIRLEFSSMPDDAALDVSHYSLTPFGRIIAVARASGEPNVLILTLDPSTIISAIGTPFVVCATGIRDTAGVALDEDRGACAGISLTEPNLDHMMVFPNPVKRSDRTLTFARLTAEAEISIYTQNMRFIRRLRTSERNGGLEWDMLDDRGQNIPSGIYLYYATGKDDHGNVVPARTEKFVIVADTR